jgi:transcriptional regulator with XRE-family HTH domain
MKGSETMSFQENLRYHRKKAGYQQAKDFAMALNISYSTYKGYESQGREPKYETLCKIADLLQVSTDDLLGRTTNILGNDEDNRLIERINDILSTDINNLDIELNKIDDKYIYFEFKNKLDLKEQIKLMIDKKNFIKNLNIIDDYFKNQKNIFIKNSLILLLFKGYEGYSDCLFKILKSNVSENKKFDTEGAILTIDKVKEFLNKHKEYIDKTKTHDIINIKKELFDKLKFY